MRRSKHRWILAWIPALVLCLGAAAQAADLKVGNFSAGSLKGWQEKSFAGRTDYQLVDDFGRTVLRADANATASGLVREIKVDLNKTPYLNWFWKVDNIYHGNKERTKKGDDYPARVYVVVSGGLLFWRTRAINYVWSSNQPVGSSWENAYSGNARMIALESGTGKTGLWLGEKRNVRKDFQRLFGSEIDKIDAVAIMTDADNTGQRATAWYGDIYFSKE
jgi:hypothetical protein